MSGAKVSPMEMKKFEYTNLQVHVGPPDGPDVTTDQAVDLSTWTNERCLAPSGEKTPGSYGDVPRFVMARVTAEESPNNPSANSSTSSLRPLRSAAKVCLEKRFNDTDGQRRQDIQAAILNNFLTKLNESSEAPEVLLPQVHKWMKTVEVFSPRTEAELNPVTTMCGASHQAIGHIPCGGETNKHQGLIVPKSLSFDFGPEKLVTRDAGDVVTPAASKRRRRRCISAKGKDPDGSDSRKSRQREQHNNLERDRRKRISLFCDELNALVPFCDPKTDRVTTLQRTTAFLHFIDKMFGDALKKEFQRTFNDKTATSPESSSSSTGPGTLGSIDVELEQ